MADAGELRGELAGWVASLRAYLEQQSDSGALGLPRGVVGPRPLGVAGAGQLTTAGTPAATAAPSPVAPNADAPVSETRKAAVTASEAAPEPRTPTGGEPSEGSRVRLPALAREIAACTRCRLAETRTQTVFARGNPDAALCFIGEAPGADEDAQGLPFVGRAGQLLDKMIAAMGLSAERDAYIVNIIRCRPPENRRPEPDEVEACLPYLHEQLELVKPKVIVALGNTSAGTLLGTKLGITKLRGQWKLYRGTTLVMPTYHPSYLLRPGAQQAEAKKQAWEDLQAVMKELQLPMPNAKKPHGSRGGAVVIDAARYFPAAAIGGGLAGVAIAVPVLGDLLRCFLCVGVMVGAAASVKLWLDAHRAEDLTPVDAATLGACSGAVSAAVSWLLSVPIRLGFGEGLSSFYESATILPDLARNNLRALYTPSGGMIVMSLPMELILFGLMGAVGGFLALQFAFAARKTDG